MTVTLRYSEEDFADVPLEDVGMGTLVDERWVLLDADAIVVDATSVYWTTSNAVMKAPRNGGTPQVIAENQSPSGSLATDGERVYWTNGSQGTLMTKASMYNQLASSVPSRHY